VEHQLPASPTPHKPDSFVINYLATAAAACRYANAPTLHRSLKIRRQSVDSTVSTPQKSYRARTVCGWRIIWRL